MTIGAVALGISLVLSGCTAPEPVATPQPSATSPVASPAPSPSAPTGPVLVPEGTAEENLPLFTSVMTAVSVTPESTTGRAYIDALVAAGFDKTAMQLTPDQSTVGNPAESIQFSVRWNDECLIGQVGPSTGAPVAVVVPVLAEGTCLVGQTRPIDW